MIFWNVFAFPSCSLLLKQQQPKITKINSRNSDFEKRTFMISNTRTKRLYWLAIIRSQGFVWKFRHTCSNTIRVHYYATLSLKWSYRIVSVSGNCNIKAYFKEERRRTESAEQSVRFFLSELVLSSAQIRHRFCMHYSG